MRKINSFTPVDNNTIFLLDANKAYGSPNISSWKDEINLVNCSQGTGSLQPIKIGSQVKFDGTDDYLQLNSPASQVDMGTNDFTISVRFKSTDYNSQRMVFGKYINSSNNFLLYTFLNGVRFIYKVADVLMWQGDVLNPNAGLVDGNEHDIVIVGDRSSGFTTYVDGISRTMTNNIQTTGDATLSANFQVGTRGTPVLFWKDFISWIQIDTTLRDQTWVNNFNTYLDLYLNNKNFVEHNKYKTF